MDKYEIKKYLIMLIDTADKIKELHSHLENVSGEDISISIIPYFSNEIKKNIEYLNQYTYDIKTCIFTIDDINILAPITDIERTYFALYPTLLDVKLHDKEWGKYSVLCSNIQEIIYLIIKQYNKRLAESSLLKDDNSKQQEIRPKPQYSKELLDLFNGHEELINELIGKSNDEVAASIKKLNKEKDKFGKPQIQNYKNNLKLTFAKELKAAGIITLSEDRFSRKL